MVRELIDHATLAVDDSSFEWLEDFQDRAGTDDSKIKWLSTVTLAQLTEDLGRGEGPGARQSEAWASRKLQEERSHAQQGLHRITEVHVR